MSASVTSLHVWSADSQVPTRVDHLTLDFSGVKGDRHYGRTMRAATREAHAFARGTEIHNYRQISIVDAVELAKIAANLGIDELEPGTIADNICTDGLPDLTALPRMTRLVFPSGASIMTGGANAPCTIAGEMVHAKYDIAAHRFPKAAIDLRGVTGWVECPGVINAGDPITVVTLN
jgi:MOSC domain-containing protein YiiM